MSIATSIQKVDRVERNFRKRCGGTKGLVEMTVPVQGFVRFTETATGRYATYDTTWWRIRLVEWSTPPDRVCTPSTLTHGAQS